MRRRGLYLAIVFVLATDAIALVGVTQNRRGEPSARLELTERELPLLGTRGPDGPGGDSTAMTLRLRWSESGAGFDGAVPVWFDKTKLEELGFDCGGPADAVSVHEACRGALPRRVWLALEFEGPAWDGWLEEKRRDLAAVEAKTRDGGATSKDLEVARNQFEYFSRSESRLLAIDAGRDPVALARRYADPRRHAIVAAVVRPRLTGDPPRLMGWIEQVLVSSIDVPATHRRTLEALPGPALAPAPTRRAGPPGHQEHEEAPPTPPQRPTDPRYAVILCFGSRHEPWIEQVRALPAPPPGPASQGPIDKTPPAR